MRISRSVIRPTPDRMEKNKLNFKLGVALLIKSKPKIIILTVLLFNHPVVWKKTHRRIK